NFGKAMTILFVSDDSCGISEATLSCSDKSKVKELSGDVTVPLWLTSTEPLKIDDAVYVTDYSDISNVASIPLNHYITADTTEWDDDGNEVEKPRKVEYLLDGKYKKLSGVFAITQNGKSSERKQQFEVYADSTLVYTSKEITSSDMPEAFEVDVENCKNLSIVITKGDGSAAVSALRAY
ncbi:MAG: NPCBM/NEW2 domain-containing protein, partial [Eubacterium sp.]|nr:NPCBM/NEW2 domain-containing protein [Eubacterium sp.]